MAILTHEDAERHHGEESLKEDAERVHQSTVLASAGISSWGRARGRVAEGPSGRPRRVPRLGEPTLSHGVKNTERTQGWAAARTVAFSSRTGRGRLCPAAAADVGQLIDRESGAALGERWRPLMLPPPLRAWMKYPEDQKGGGNL